MTWFAEALRAVAPSLRAAPGLRAVARTHHPHLHPVEPRHLEGSCNLDEALAAQCPDEPRWDYVVAYEGRTWFVEVHPARSGANADEVIAKARWLATLPGGNALRARTAGAWWVASGGTHLLRFGRKAHQLAALGVIGPVRRVDLR